MEKALRVNWDVVRDKMDDMGVPPRNHVQYLSKLIGVHRATINRMRGGAVLPNPLHLSKICDLLNIGEDRILTLKEVASGPKEEQWTRFS